MSIERPNSTSSAPDPEDPAERLREWGEIQNELERQADEKRESAFYLNEKKNSMANESNQGNEDIERPEGGQEEWVRPLLDEIERTNREIEDGNIDSEIVDLNRSLKLARDFDFNIERIKERIRSIEDGDEKEDLKKALETLQHERGAWEDYKEQEREALHDLARHVFDIIEETDRLIEGGDISSETIERNEAAKIAREFDFDVEKIDAALEEEHDPEKLRLLTSASAFLKAEIEGRRMADGEAQGPAEPQSTPGEPGEPERAEPVEPTEPVESVPAEPAGPGEPEPAESLSPADRIRSHFEREIEETDRLIEAGLGTPAVVARNNLAKTARAHNYDLRRIDEARARAIDAGDAEQVRILGEAMEFIRNLSGESAEAAGPSEEERRVEEARRREEIRNALVDAVQKLVARDAMTEERREIFNQSLLQAWEDADSEIPPGADVQAVASTFLDKIVDNLPEEEFRGIKEIKSGNPEAYRALKNQLIDVITSPRFEREAKAQRFMESFGLPVEARAVFDQVFNWVERSKEPPREGETEEERRGRLEEERSKWGKRLGELGNKALVGAGFALSTAILFLLLSTIALIYAFDFVYKKAGGKDFNVTKWL